MSTIFAGLLAIALWLIPMVMPAAIAPIEYTRDRATARDLLLKVLQVVPRIGVVAQTDDYIRAKSTSRLLGFVDDLEFYLPALGRAPGGI